VSIILPLKPVTILIIMKFYKRPGYYIFWNKQGSAKSNRTSKSTKYQQHIEYVFLYDKTLQNKKCVTGDS
jgi:hypothetical protein